MEELTPGTHGGASRSPAGGGAREGAYDVVVIGAASGALGGAALLVRAGKQVVPGGAISRPAVPLQA